MKSLKLFLAFLLLCFVHPVLAEVKLSTYYVPGLVEDENTGSFVDLNREIFSMIGKKAQLVIEPTQKAQISFFTGKTEAIFPELMEGLRRYQSRGDFIVSEPFWKKHVFLYQRNSSAYTSLEGLYNKPIGAVKGYSYGEEITSNPSLNIKYNSNDIMNIKLLLAGELEAVLGDDTSTLQAVQLANAEQLITFDLRQPLVSLDTFYVCHNNPQGIALCGDISNAIRVLKRESVINVDSTAGESRINSAR